VLIIVPTTALQDQWYITLMDELNLQANEITVWPNEKRIESKYHLMVVNTARIQAKSFYIKDLPSLLIADECHRFASAENSNALMLPYSATLGLTATAERDFDDGLEEILIPNLGKVIYKYTLADARNDGVVSPFEVLNVKVEMTEMENAEYQKFTSKLARAYSMGDEEKAKVIARLRAAVSRNAAKRIPAAIAIVEENRGKRIIVFHEEIEKAEIIRRILYDRGHSVGIYHSQLSDDRRRDNLLQFRRGMIEILVCCRALDEGVDVPEADVAVIAASTSSSRQRIQRVGRVIRLHKDKDFARIYTLYATEREENFLKGEELRLSSILKFRWYEMKVS
jgi:superfamily II DNA or RNA helicase